MTHPPKSPSLGTERGTSIRTTNTPRAGSREVAGAGLLCCMLTEQQSTDQGQNQSPVWRDRSVRRRAGRDNSNGCNGNKITVKWSQQLPPRRKPQHFLRVLCGTWILAAKSAPAPEPCSVTSQGKGGETSPHRAHRVTQRCKFYPWMLLVWRIALVKNGADVTAAAAIKQKNTKLVSTSRIPSFLCPQNGIRKSRASINEIISYVTGSSFFVLFWLYFPKEMKLIWSVTVIS